MAIGLTSDENYTAIADAIRAKTESEETYTPAEMPAAIMAIETGSDIEIDTTLTVSGAAADAKVVGDTFTEIGNMFEEIVNQFEEVDNKFTEVDKAVDDVESKITTVEDKINNLQNSVGSKVQLIIWGAED